MQICECSHFRTCSTNADGFASHALRWTHPRKFILVFSTPKLHRSLILQTTTYSNYSHALWFLQTHASTSSRSSLSRARPAPPCMYALALAPSQELGATPTGYPESDTKKCLVCSVWGTPWADARALSGQARPGRGTQRRDPFGPRLGLFFRKGGLNI